jgi:hypothetical protein
MAEINIWTGTSTFTTGSTPFGFYDDDVAFQADADKVARFCAQRLGYPLMDVELTSGSFYTCFEEAVTTYGNEVFQYKVRENYLSLEGATTGSNANESLLEPTLTRLIQITQNYGTEAGAGGNVSKYSGSITLQPGQQTYDLQDWASSQGITGSIEVRKVFYHSPPAILRYFDPFAGTGTGFQSLMDAFDFGSYSPGMNFLMMPASFDIMKVQAIEFSDQIRKSAYSFEIVHNDLKIFPVPKNMGALWIEYFKVDEKNSTVFNLAPSKITNISEVPYHNPEYYKLNSIGKQWVFKYSLAISKELLGYIRGKYKTLPIPGAETTLNSDQLLEDSRTEKLELTMSLRDTLDQTSRVSQLERKSKENNYIKDVVTGVPMVIYVG